MGQNNQSLVYDPATGKGITVEEAQAALGTRAPGTLFQGGGRDQRVGFDMPPVSKEVGAQMVDAIPQLAGLVAMAVPQLRTLKGAMLVPGIAEAVTRQMSGEDFDLGAVVEEALLGAGAHGAGRFVNAIGSGGTNLIRRSLNIRDPYNTRAGETNLPKAAIREGARMTREGVDKIVARAAQTGLGSLDDLAVVMERARMDNSLAPVGGAGGVMAFIRDLLSPPKQMALGQGMATVGKGADATEASLRSFMAWLESQAGQATPMATPEATGPQRRRLAP